MSGRISNSKIQLAMLGIVVLAAVGYCLACGNCSLLTPDQRAYRLFVNEQYAAAAERFADPMWRGVALFKQGQFDEAAGVFAGYDTAEAAFNQGNALVMQGKYEPAAERYARALELRPGWEDARINRAIALGRAEMLKDEGGDMTGGMLPPDEIVVSDQKSPSSAPEEQVESATGVSNEAEMRAVWLRQVQTKPADFLRAKFAYQYGKQESGR